VVKEYNAAELGAYPVLKAILKVGWWLRVVEGTMGGMALQIPAILVGGTGDVACFPPSAPSPSPLSSPTHSLMYMPHDSLTSLILTHSLMYSLMYPPSTSALPRPIPRVLPESLGLKI
jgi:hypothetical protein